MGIGKKIVLLTILAVVFLFVFFFALMGAQKDLKFTILYDNYVYKEGTKADWGFSCLVEGPEKTILFDTGTKPAILLHNIEEMNVDLNKIDAVVISHDHGDHTGGLLTVLKINPHVSVYLPVSFASKYEQKVDKDKTRVIAVNESIKICKDVYSTGEMGTEIKEQSLILDTPKGLIIVTGCSHQGIVNILKKAKDVLDKDIYMVFGGFHLMRNSEEQVKDIIKIFKEMGVQKCGATHCTGDRQIELFKKAYGDNYVPIGTGNILKIDLK
jgi:7,8-dihydropterin-6-yl-methyl-4-(beta-D-ribofuranosyl)aminobenzene 5'-phosphate synthase